MGNPDITNAADSTSAQTAPAATEAAKVKLAKAAAKPRAPAKPKAPEAPAPDETIVISADPREPRYEAAVWNAEHDIISDPESHVRHCSKCDMPEHMTDGVDCAPRGA